MARWAENRISLKALGMVAYSKYNCKTCQQQFVAEPSANVCQGLTAYLQALGENKPNILGCHKCSDTSDS